MLCDLIVLLLGFDSVQVLCSPVHHQEGGMVAGTGCDQSGTYLVVSCLCLGGVVCAAHPLLPVARTYHLCRCPFKLRAERHGRR